MKVDSYYIDENNNLHTYIKEKKHFIISNVKTDEKANEIIKELNDEERSNK